MEEIQPPASASCGTELTRSNSYSDTSALTSEIYEDIFQRKANKRPYILAAVNLLELKIRSGCGLLHPVCEMFITWGLYELILVKSCTIRIGLRPERVSLIPLENASKGKKTRGGSAKKKKLECECAARKNEKHDQYLNRLEASFVEQFHQSLGQLAWCSERIKNARTSTDKKPANTSSEQFTVLRNGRWQKIKYGKTTTVGFDYVLRSPRVEHFQLAGIPCLKKSSDPLICSKIHRDNDFLKEQMRSCHGVWGCTEDLPINYTYHCDSAGNDEALHGINIRGFAEGSGQNFKEDELKFRTKKLKTAVVEPLDDDQIVPCAKSNLVADLVEGRDRHQNPSEDYGSFACPQPVAISFLGGTDASASSDGPIT